MKPSRTPQQPSVERDTLIKYLREFLKTDEFQDTCVNGLQVEGAPVIQKILTAVSISRAVIEEAIRRSAQLIIAHHGFFKGDIPNPLRLTGYRRQRLKALLAHDINFAAYHLPLDAHPQVGNNAVAAQQLGLHGLKPVEVGFTGHFSQPQKLTNLLPKIDRIFGGAQLTLPYGPAAVRSVTIISGGSAYMWEDALDSGAELFICGGMKEQFVRAVEESGMNVVCVGHYNSEKLGIKALSPQLAEHFGIPVEFFDVPNPV